MTNTPHVEMGAELKVLSHSGPVIAFYEFEQSERAKQIIAFIHQCQKIHAKSPSDFNDFFENGFKDNQLIEAVSRVFFSTIQAEIEFINSLYFILAEGEGKLKGLGYLNEHGQSLYALSSLINRVPRFIDPTVSHTDAANLAALGRLFEASTTDKKQLIKELLWNATRQAGTTYMEFPKLGATCTEPSVFIDCQSPVGLTSKVGVAGTPYSIFHQREVVVQQLNAASVDSGKHGDFDGIPMIDVEYDSHSEDGDSVPVGDDATMLRASVFPPS